MMPALRPWSSACWPSVADTVELEISFSSTGSAPICRICDEVLRLAEAETVDFGAVRPSIPFGFST